MRSAISVICKESLHRSCKSSRALPIHGGRAVRCLSGQRFTPDTVESSSQHIASIDKELAGIGAAQCWTRRNAVFTPSPVANAVAAAGKAAQSKATRRLGSEIETARKRPLGSKKLSRWVVPAGLKISIGPELTDRKSTRLNSSH